MTTHKTTITKSRSGHYTVTVRDVARNVLVFHARKLSSLVNARFALAEFKASQ